MLSLLIQLQIYRTRDFSFVYDGCEYRSLTSREKHKHSAFKDVVVRKTIERK